MRITISKVHVKADDMVDAAEDRVRRAVSGPRETAVTGTRAASRMKADSKVSLGILGIEVRALMLWVVEAEYFREWKGAAAECLEGAPVLTQKKQKITPLAWVMFFCVYLNCQLCSHKRLHF